jgi:hypothetical protein
MAILGAILGVISGAILASEAGKARRGDAPYPFRGLLTRASVKAQTMNISPTALTMIRVSAGIDGSKLT